jgi:hypothetical protein
MEELRRMFRNGFEKQMVLSYNSTQCGKTAEYLQWGIRKREKLERSDEDDQR